MDNSSIFETRQRAQKLLKDAVAIWRKSDQSDYLEGIENDPVFSLLMMAVAYQAGETDSEIERLRVDTLDELARMLAPYEIGHATPATLVVSTALQQGVSELETDANTLFQLAAHPFIPLMKTRVLDAQVGSVIRLDGRRWKVRLDFGHSVSNLGGFSFAVDGLDFRDLTVTVGKTLLPLIKPWDYSELPFNECFSPQNMLYNRQQVCNMSMLPIDLFARHNVRMFFVDRYSSSLQNVTDANRVELVFEFSGITDNFLFDKTHFHLNTMVLVNAQLHESNLSARKPFDRIAGYSDTRDRSDVSSRQFMHLLQPLENQIFGNTELEVRRVNADRFNQGSLVRLLQSILNKYHSDFYAFQNLKGMTTDKTMYDLQKLLKSLIDAGTEDPQRNVPGVYLLLKDRSQMQNKDFSLSVKYLTTAGAAVNQYFGGNVRLSSPSGFDSDATTVLAPPIPGTDDADSDTGANSLLRYYMLTNDRVVTPADIKMFCYKELMTRYGLSDSMIKRIRVSRRQTMDRRDCGYEIVVEITIAGSSYVVQSFGNSVSTAEVLMQKMIEVRGANVYPVRVSIVMESES